MVHLIYLGQIEGKWAFRESRIRGTPGVLEFQHPGTHKSTFELQSDLLRSALHSNFEHCAFHELLAYSAIAAPNCRTDQLLVSNRTVIHFLINRTDWLRNTLVTMSAGYPLAVNEHSHL